MFFLISEMDVTKNGTLVSSVKACKSSEKQPRQEGKLLYLWQPWR